MIPNEDIFKTIGENSGPVLFKDKNSKFYGYAFPIRTELEVKPHLEILRKKHSGAGHFCYAFQIGFPDFLYRYSDDGEPSNSAGAPIYGQIQSFGLTNILVVVLRYFGGVKLGVPGLISAYRTGAQLVLADSEIIEQTVKKSFAIQFEYKNLDKVMRIIKQKGLEIESQNMELQCAMQLSVRPALYENAISAFGEFHEIEIRQPDVNR